MTIRRTTASLFARLLGLQLGLLLLATLIFGLLVYVERNVTIAHLVGERWAPALAHAAGAPGSAGGPPPGEILRRSVPPQGLTPRLSPRLTALRRELQQRGLSVQEMRVSRGTDGPLLWLRLGTVDGGSAWFGIRDTALLPRLPMRLTLAFGLTVLLLAAISWVFTRRLTRPLEVLRARIDAQQPGSLAPMAPAPLAAVPEIAAIDTAYRELLARYQRHERERALLLAGVSHDLRGPLTRIRLAASLLPEQAGVSERREAIERNAMTADRLIQDFLDHVRAGELALDQPADLAALARELQAACAREGRPLDLDAPLQLMLARSHPLLLERLLHNLVDNAFKHGAAPVTLSVAQRDGQAWILVGDAGPGLPPGQQAHLLAAFARGDASRHTPGTGLGLAIAARIVARLGGELSFAQVGGRHQVSAHWPLN
jgi:two-component system, OmpR family, osmolarity sensor histidine kinase EnvZ